MQNTLPPDTPALAVEKVSKIYPQLQRGGRLKDVLKNLFRPQRRDIHALDGLDLTVQPGEFLAYAGANGAGKSTTIKILSGILQPTGGTVRVMGLNPARHRVALMSRIGVLFGQRSELWWDYPVIANYEWKKRVWNVDDTTYRRMLNTVTDMLELGPLLNTFVRELSLGQRMRADLGMLLLHNPQMIFLDEPTLGLDLLAKRQLIAFLKHINAEEGTTILVTSHDMDDLQEMARRIVLLSHGKKAFDGSFDELRAGSRADTLRVRVVADGEQLPQVPGLQLASQSGDERVFTVSGAQAGLNQVLTGIAAIPGIREVEIQKPSIEDVIAGLYEKWG